MISLDDIPVIEPFDGLNVGEFTGEQFLCFFSDTLRDIAKTEPQTARLITRIGERDDPGAVKEMVRLMLPHFEEETCECRTPLSSEGKSIRRER